MRVLFIGGTGTISAAITALAVKLGWEVFHLNRGSRKEETAGIAAGVKHIRCDIRETGHEAIRKKIMAQLPQNARFDAVCDFIGFVPAHVKKDFDIFDGLCRQFVFISSASAYQKPLSSYLVTESTPLANPYWEYSRNKIACEEFLVQKYRESGFPVTIVRPSHTYDERSVPLGVHGENGSWQVLKRITEGKSVIIHGDGTSLWTMTHASDFARAFVRLLGNIHAIGEAVHITSDETVTWNQIYQTIACALDAKLKPLYVPSDLLEKLSGGRYDFKGSLTGDKANSAVFDNTKIKRLAPGFCAKVRLDEGLKGTIANVLSKPHLQKEDPEFDAWCDKVEAALGALPV